MVQPSSAISQPPALYVLPQVQRTSVPSTEAAGFAPQRQLRYNLPGWPMGVDWSRIRATLTSAVKVLDMVFSQGSPGGIALALEVNIGQLPGRTMGYCNGIVTVVYTPFTLRPAPVPPAAPLSEPARERLGTAPVERARRAARPSAPTCAATRLPRSWLAQCWGRTPAGRGVSCRLRLWCPQRFRAAPIVPDREVHHDGHLELEILHALPHATREACALHTWRNGERQLVVDRQVQRNAVLAANRRNPHHRCLHHVALAALE